MPQNCKLRKIVQMMRVSRTSLLVQILFSLILCCTITNADDSWTQLKGNSQRSGNAADVTLKTPLSLAAAIPLTDGIYTSPVVSEDKVFVIDGSGIVFAIDTTSNKVVWKFATRGGLGNCNNVASPAIINNYLHVVSARPPATIMFLIARVALSSKKLTVASRFFPPPSSMQIGYTLRLSEHKSMR